MTEDEMNRRINENELAYVAIGETVNRVYAAGVSLDMIELAVDRIWRDVVEKQDGALGVASRYIEAVVEEVELNCPEALEELRAKLLEMAETISRLCGAGTSAEVIAFPTTPEARP